MFHLVNQAKEIISNNLYKQFKEENQTELLQELPEIEQKRVHFQKVKTQLTHARSILQQW